MEEAVLKEYLFLQQVYEDFNSQVIDFKSWSVSVGIASIIAAYSKPVAPAGRIGVIVASLVAFPFWLTESFWKHFQAAYKGRIEEIEACMRSGCTDLQPLQIMTRWQETYEASPFLDWVRVAFDPHVLFPHVFLLVVGLALAWLRPPAVAKSTEG